MGFTAPCWLQPLLSHIRITYYLVRKGSPWDQNPVPCLYILEEECLPREEKAHWVETLDGTARCLVILWKNPFIRNMPAKTERRKEAVCQIFLLQWNTSSLGTVVTVRNTGNSQSSLTQMNKTRLMIVWVVGISHTAFPLALSPALLQLTQIPPLLNNTQA